MTHGSYNDNLSVWSEPALKRELESTQPLPIGCIVKFSFINLYFLYLFNKHVLNAFYLTSRKVHKTSQCPSWVTSMPWHKFFSCISLWGMFFLNNSKNKTCQLFQCFNFCVKRVQYKPIHIFQFNSPVFIESLSALIISIALLHCFLLSQEQWTWDVEWDV